MTASPTYSTARRPEPPRHTRSTRRPTARKSPPGRTAIRAKTATKTKGVAVRRKLGGQHVLEDDGGPAEDEAAETAPARLPMPPMTVATNAISTGVRPIVDAEGAGLADEQDGGDPGEHAR